MVLRDDPHPQLTMALKPIKVTKNNHNHKHRREDTKSGVALAQTKKGRRSDQVHPHPPPMANCLNRDRKGGRSKLGLIFIHTPKAMGAAGGWLRSLTTDHRRNTTGTRRLRIHPHTYKSLRSSKKTLTFFTLGNPQADLKRNACLALRKSGTLGIDLLTHQASMESPPSRNVGTQRYRSCASLTTATQTK